MEEIHYRGHRIGIGLKSVDRKNPISGHEWSEPVEMKTLCVSVIEGYAGCTTPTRPALPWHQRVFKSVAVAQRDIDAAISLERLVAIERHKAGHVPSNRHEQQWQENIEAELAQETASERPRG